MVLFIVFTITLIFQDTESSPLFFGRKFEAVINQQVINQVERFIGHISPKQLTGE